MPTSPSPEWARRHRQQHALYLRNLKPGQYPHARHFASEFEAALRQRGAAAKAAAAAKRGSR